MTAAAKGAVRYLIFFMVASACGCMSLCFSSSKRLCISQCRSGRAARAGRTGYAFALVEPDETPFMIDLHLFLGRKVLSPALNDIPEKVSYDLASQTPDDVHFGCVPESVLMDENENVRRLIQNEGGNKVGMDFER